MDAERLAAAGVRRCGQVNNIRLCMQLKQQTRLKVKFFTDKCEAGLIFFSGGGASFALNLKKKKPPHKEPCSVFHCFTTEKPSVPLLSEELYYVLIIRNYQPALNSSRLHCLRLMWLIQLLGAYFILGRKRLTQ